MKAPATTVIDILSLNFYSELLMRGLNYWDEPESWAGDFADNFANVGDANHYGDLYSYY